MATQLSIDGIGQQLASVEDWMKEHEVYTHRSNNEYVDPWSAWDGDPDPAEALGRYGDDYFGFGATQKEAIFDLCKKIEIKPPFWW